jgi:hypothetical protein
MTEVGRIAPAIDRRSRNHMAHRAAHRGAAGLIRNMFSGSATQDELDDKARWLEGQVQGWTAARTL